MISESIPQITPSAYPTFASWQAAVQQLPLGVKNGTITLRGTNYEGIQSPALLTEQEFNRALDQFNAQAQANLRDSTAWLDGKIMAPGTVYMQKHHFAVGNKPIPLGDLHGDVHGIVASLAPYIDPTSFAFKDNNTYLVCHGDYVDRGIYGYESIYSLLRIKNANPDRVFLIRGNHEDKDVCHRYGFTQELAHKKISPATVKKIFDWYELLPAALFVICHDNGVQACHGGIDPNYKPLNFINAEKNIRYEQTTLTTYNGFMWGDFHLDPNAPSNNGASSGRPCHSKQDTYHYLQEASKGRVKLRGILRAHQHGDDAMMGRILGKDGMNNDNHGACKLWTSRAKTGNLLWPGIVVTWNVCPDTVYGLGHGFTYSTHGILTLQEKFEDWRLEVKRVEVIK